MAEVFRIAAQISTPIALAAFAVACVLWLIDRTFKYRGKINDKIHRLLVFAVLGCLSLGLLSIAGDIYLKHEAGLTSVYRVRVTVIGTEHTPVENAAVWTSIGGEPKKVNGGWEFDIPSANKPLDGEITIYAKIENSSLQGKANLRLETDRNPSIVVSLEPDESAIVRGTVEDDSGHALRGVDVSVVGYGNEHVTTSESGSFILRAHAADGHTVRLHAEAPDYQPLDQDQPAGTTSAILVLHGKHGHP
jgi:hypothetical protein